MKAIHVEGTMLTVVAAQPVQGCSLPVLRTSSEKGMTGKDVGKGEGGQT